MTLETGGAAPSGGDSPGGATPAGERWIETRGGGLFFVNALLIFPYIMVVVPLATRVFVRGVAGGLRRESVIVDTFPTLAEHLLPRMGWLIVVPLGLTLLALRHETEPLPRFGLFAFLVLHLLALGWTLGVWTGVVPPVLPGGPAGLGAP